MTPTVPDSDLADAVFRLVRSAYGRGVEQAPEPTMAEVRAVLAHPAAGRDLTAQDVRDAVRDWVGIRITVEMAVDRLNKIARPAVARTDGQPPADVRERVAEAIAQAIGHRKDYDTPDCSDADSTLGCQHPGGHPQEPGCEDCASWGWPCSVALTAADAAIEAAENPDPASWPRDTHPVRQEYEDVVQRVAQELFALHGGPGSVWADLTCELAEGWREQARTVLRGARVPVLVSVEESDDVDW